MASAIAEVMPNTSHRLCMWHLMQNAIKHVNHLFQGENGIKKVLGKFYEEIEDEEQWLTDWDNMLEELDCRDNHWLKKTFKDRKKWAYPYIRSTWSSGKRSTQLSESFNSRLKDYLRSDHDLMQFFANFDRVLNDKRYKELESEYALIHKSPSIKVKAAILIQAEQIYTKIVFEEFFVQFEASIEGMILSTVEEMGVVVYMVKEAGFDKKVRRVTRDEFDMIKCSCMLFEQRCYLCSHCIKVLREKTHVTHIPEQYVLKRWTRKARAESAKDRFGCEVQFDVRLYQSERHRNLSNKWRVLTCRASVCDETYRYVDSKTIKMIDVVENMLSLKIDGNLQHHGNEASGSGEIGSAEAFAMIAKGLKRKKATSRGKRRIIGGFEKALTSRNNKSSADQRKNKSSSRLKRNEPPNFGRDIEPDVYEQSPTPLCDSSLGPSLLHFHGANTQSPMMYQPVSWLPYPQVQPRPCGFQALLQGGMFPHHMTFPESQTSNSNNPNSQGS